MTPTPERAVTPMEDPMPDDPDAALIEAMVIANYGGSPEQALAGIGPFAMKGERKAMRRVLAVVREHEWRALAEAHAENERLRQAMMEMGNRSRAEGYRAGIEAAANVHVPGVVGMRTLGPEAKAAIRALADKPKEGSDAA